LEREKRYTIEVTLKFFKSNISSKGESEKEREKERGGEGRRDGLREKKKAMDGEANLKSADFRRSRPLFSLWFLPGSTCV
jgi:hypothetical protein